jgi:hypothetical protein
MYGLRSMAPRNSVVTESWLKMDSRAGLRIRGGRPQGRGFTGGGK